MSEEKNFKYKVQLAKDIRKVRDIPGDTARKNVLVIRNGRKGIFKPTLNVRAKKMDIPEDRKTCSEYGEFIAHKILEQIGIESCDVDILKNYMVNTRSKSGRGNEIPGVISYIDLEDGEDLVNAMEIVNWFELHHRDEISKILEGEVNQTNIFSDVNYNNIEIIIPAFMRYIKEMCGGTDEQAQEIKQKIIDMVMFDCRFANRDRHDENYGVAVKRNNGGFRFYPLYDNEYILGLSELTSDIDKYSAARLQGHINVDLYSVMGVNSKPTQLTSAEMLVYLFSAYPVEAQKAYEKIMKFKNEDLVAIMSECEGLPEKHQVYAERIFRVRGKELEAIQEEFIDIDGKPKVQILPGDKPMEIDENSANDTAKKYRKDASEKKAKKPSGKNQTRIVASPKRSPKADGIGEDKTKEKGLGDD